MFVHLAAHGMIDTQTGPLDYKDCPKTDTNKYKVEGLLILTTCT